MPRIKDIKTRSISIQKIKKITSAMEIVALTKLRKIEKETLGTRSYFDKIRELLFNIRASTNFNMHILLEEKPSIYPQVAIVLGSDKGLCGNFNNNVINKISRLKENFPDETLRVIAIGKRLIKYIKRRPKEFDILNTYSPINFNTLPDAVAEMAGMLIDEFRQRKINSLYLIYNEYKRHIKGEAKTVKLLPLVLDEEIELARHRNYIYEPEPQQILDLLLKEYIANQIHHSVLESCAAEEMARMLAMKAATDNAKELMDKLTLQYHKARQRQITTELMDIISAA